MVRVKWLYIIYVQARCALVIAGDNGSMYFWDWKSGYNFQRIQAVVQPGSLDSEAGIFASTFDNSGSRLLTCEADKSIKIYKEDESAVRMDVVVVTVVQFGFGVRSPFLF